MQRALDFLLQTKRHVVAQIVKAIFVVGSVGDIGIISGPLLLRTHAGDHYANAHAEKLIDLSHPLGIAPRQIVVNGDHMDALTGQRIEINRQRGH